MKITALAFSSILVFSSALFGQMEDFSSTSFRKADSIALSYSNHSLSNLRDLAFKLTKPLSTDVEKFRAIYRWTCDNIENDYYLFKKINTKEKNLKTAIDLEEWNKKLNRIVFETLLKNQKTICTGYAYVVKELTLHAGITCVIVDGYGRTTMANIRGPGIANHSWNAIQLNNKWYLCDATWSSGAIDTEKRSFIKKYNDSYFLLDPSLFIRNHYPLDSTWMLLDSKPTLIEFLNRPLIYSNLFQYQIDRLFPETFDVQAVKEKPFAFQFTGHGGKAIKKLELEITGPDGVYSIFPKLQQDSGLYSFDYTFKRKGTHIVHVLLNNSYAFSYSVKVLKRAEGQ